MASLSSHPIESESVTENLRIFVPAGSNESVEPVYHAIENLERHAPLIPSDRSTSHTKDEVLNYFDKIFSRELKTSPAQFAKLQKFVEDMLRDYADNKKLNIIDLEVLQHEEEQKGLDTSKTTTDRSWHLATSYAIGAVKKNFSHIGIKSDVSVTEKRNKILIPAAPSAPPPRIEATVREKPVHQLAPVVVTAAVSQPAPGHTSPGRHSANGAESPTEKATLTRIHDIMARSRSAGSNSAPISSPPDSPSVVVAEPDFTEPSDESAKTAASLLPEKDIQTTGNTLLESALNGMIAVESHNVNATLERPPEQEKPPSADASEKLEAASPPRKRAVVAKGVTSGGRARTAGTGGRVALSDAPSATEATEPRISGSVIRKINGVGAAMPFIENPNAHYELSSVARQGMKALEGNVPTDVFRRLEQATNHALAVYKTRNGGITATEVRYVIRCELGVASHPNTNNELADVHRAVAGILTEGLREPEKLAIIPVRSGKRAHGYTERFRPKAEIQQLAEKTPTDSTPENHMSQNTAIITAALNDPTAEQQELMGELNEWMQFFNERAQHGGINGNCQTLFGATTAKELLSIPPELISERIRAAQSQTTFITLKKDLELEIGGRYSDFYQALGIQPGELPSR